MRQYEQGGGAALVMLCRLLTNVNKKMVFFNEGFPNAFSPFGSLDSDRHLNFENRGFWKHLEKTIQDSIQILICPLSDG